MISCTSNEEIEKNLPRILALLPIVQNDRGWKSQDSSDRIVFFQAEDGIRDYKVTGVQTCALPILLVGGAEIALDAIARVGLVLAIGDGRTDREHGGRQHDCARQQPMQGPFGAPVLAPRDRKSVV